MIISNNECKRLVLTRVVLVVALAFSVLRAILLPPDTYIFIVHVLPILIVILNFILSKKLINNKCCQRLLLLPIVIALIIYILYLLENIKSLEIYSQHPYLYNVTNLKLILLYVLNCGPSVVAVVSLIFAGISSFFKKQRTVIASSFLGISAIIRLIDGAFLLIRATEVFIQEFGIAYVLFQIATILSDVLVLISLSTLLLTNISNNYSKSEE